MHKIANVLDKLPKRVKSRGKATLHEVMYAPMREAAQEALGDVGRELEARYPKAATCLCLHEEELFTFFDFPAQHWQHLRTMNPIESPFATVKGRLRRIKGAGSRHAGLAMAFKLILSAWDHWRRVRAPHLVALVRVGVLFKDGEQVACTK